MRKYSSQLHLLIVILFLTLSIYPDPINQSDLGAIGGSITQEYTVHDPIVIRNDTELAAVANSGNGSVNNPYIITGWNITGSATNGISIRGTTKYFRIERCWIARATNYGIYLYYVPTGTADITNNFCINNGQRGIYTYYSKYTKITNNTLISNGNHGIGVCNSEYSLVANNTFLNDGLFVWIINPEVGNYLTYTVKNNTVNGLPLGYFENKTDSILTGTYGQLILVNCSNVVVKNQNCSSTSVGITLFYSSENQLFNNTCNRNSVGISISYSDSITVTNNTCNNNIWNGIEFWVEYWGEPHTSIVANNTCTNNRYAGIILEAHYSFLTGNICNNNTEAGIYLFFSTFMTLANNTCINNNRSGVYMDHSHDSTLTNNTCISNNESGIYLEFSGNNFITWNTLISNREYGISLNTYSFDNTIHHNSFFNNGQGDSQAFDNNSGTFWYDQASLVGNFWSDYSGEGSYIIAGTAEKTDPYPSHTHSPSISHPDNLTFIAGETGQVISWLATDPNNNPSSYIIYRNGSIFTTDSWSSGVAITVTVDDLEPGCYNFTIVVTDTDQFSTSSTVWVTVIAETTTPTTSSETFTTSSSSEPHTTTTTTSVTHYVYYYIIGFFFFILIRKRKNE